MALLLKFLEAEHNSGELRYTTIALISHVIQAPG